MRLFDLLYGMRMGGNQPPQQLQAPGMSAPYPASQFQAPPMSTNTPPMGFQAPNMSAPQPPQQFQPPSMSTPTPPQAMGQQMNPWGRFQSPEHQRAGWMGARAPWSFEP